MHGCDGTWSQARTQAKTQARTQGKQGLGMRDGVSRRRLTREQMDRKQGMG